METTADKKPRRRRSFTPEFKAEVVALVRQPGRTVGSVARELDLTETAVREWVKQAERDERTRADGLSTAERAEMAQLRNDDGVPQEERRPGVPQEEPVAPRACASTAAEGPSGFVRERTKRDTGTANRPRLDATRVYTLAI